MSKLVDLLWEVRKEQEKYFKNYKQWAKKIKTICQKRLGDVRVLIFGSVLRKNEVPRDIDILVVSPMVKHLSPQEKSKLKAEIFKEIGYFAPFEIHIVSDNDYQRWYKNFIKDESIPV